MNPQEQSTAFELPPADASEPRPSVQSETQRTLTTEEQSSKALEQGVSQHQPPQQPPSSAPPPPTTQADSSQQDAGSVHLGTAQLPQIADDNDLIEKEWVIIAKQIVARTARDPHLQNREINRFKADYLKKRYNKEIKLVEDA